MVAAELIAFERVVAEEFEQGKIRAPIHLSGGNEEELIRVFRDVHPKAWVFSTWRWHYHALLHGVPQEKVMAEIRAKGMNASFPEHRFYSSAIVGGILPIAVGVAAAIKRVGGSRMVWCFVGDMAATTGIFHESAEYAAGHDLPIEFVIEDNGFSTNAPTEQVWGERDLRKHPRRYSYERTFPHMGTGKWVQF